MLALIIALFVIGNIPIYAHSDLLNVEYDACQDSSGDGENEAWYFLKSETSTQILGTSYYFDWYYHIDHELTTLKYYFADSLDGYYWDTTVSTNDANIVKAAYLESMKKWTHTYYYSYDENGNRNAQQIINLIPGTATDYNIIIYPVSAANAVYNGTNYIALTGPENIPEFDFNNLIEHFHFNKWSMKVNVEDIVANSSYNEYVGAHEMGHVLGLRDADSCCKVVSYWHHGELLMGYASPNSTEASYKDIAGVAITRGFHTDDDHVWMLRTNSDGTKDVICAQCNGVRYNISLTDGKYEGKTANEYKSCVHHNGTNQKMLLVATDGDRYFYKCQYCRYIATFEEENATHISANGTNSDITLSIPANSEVYYRVVAYDTFTYNLKSSNYDVDISLCDSNMNILDVDLSDASTSDGVDVSLLDDNTYYLKIKNNYNVGKNVTISLYGPHSHSFDYWVYLNPTTHISECTCGARGTTTEPHAFVAPDIFSFERICVGCGYTKIAGSDGGQIILSTQKVSLNGSYILPDGNIVLVEEDVEAYLNGTLVFYDKDKLPVTQ